MWLTNASPIKPQARIKDLETAADYLAAKRFVEDPAAERERQRVELLEKLEAKAMRIEWMARCSPSLSSRLGVNSLRAVYEQLP